MQITKFSVTYKSWYSKKFFWTTQNALCGAIVSDILRVSRLPKQKLSFTLVMIAKIWYLKIRSESFAKLRQIRSKLISIQKEFEFTNSSYSLVPPISDWTYSFFDMVEKLVFTKSLHRNIVMKTAYWSEGSRKFRRFPHCTLALFFFFLFSLICLPAKIFYYIWKLEIFC